jgi:hypothetical protein
MRAKPLLYGHGGLYVLTFIILSKLLGKTLAVNSCGKALWAKLFGQGSLGKTLWARLFEQSSLSKALWAKLFGQSSLDKALWGEFTGYAVSRENPMYLYYI